MLELKTIIEKYPRSAGTRSQLASLLHDLYPSEKRAVNVALAVYDSGIVSRFAGLKTIDSVLLHNFINQLVNEYGLQEQFATEGIVIWAKAYGVSIPSVSYNFQPNKNQTPSTNNSSEFAKPGAINGSASDYEIVQRQQGVVIAKFRGFDEEDVIIPNIIAGEKVIGVGENAYRNCKSMKTLIISDGIYFIEDGAFADCENLSKVVFPTTLCRIGSEKSYHSKGAFEHSGVTNISLPDGLMELGKRSFSMCSKLETINLSSELKIIDDYTFYGCSSLSKIVLPEKITKLGTSSFERCYKLIDVYLPMSLKEIGASSFEGCSELSVVVLNEGLNKICKDAFSNCKKLSKILIPSTVTEIGTKRSFENNDVFTITGWYQPDRRYNGWKTNKKNTNLTIYCYSGSYALEYARNLGYPIQNATNFSN